MIGSSLDNNGVETLLNYRETKEYKNRESVLVKVHDSEILQVILVFLENAKDALLQKKPDKPYISIECVNYPEDGFVEVQVCDNGGGVPQELMQKIFEPYFSTKSAKHGTGLGLYITKIIIEKYQSGSISVRNSEDGACFCIKLPLYKGD